MVTPEQRAAEYAICQRRGHQPEPMVLTSNPPQSRCKWCGTVYRYEKQLVESRRP